MGTPHSMSEDNEKWQKIAILPQVTGYNFKVPPLDHNSIQTLTHHSLLFDQSGVNCPILSMCETRETKVRQGMGSKRIMVCVLFFLRRPGTLNLQRSLWTKIL
jgi:hypothetical protein